MDPGNAPTRTSRFLRLSSHDRTSGSTSNFEVQLGGASASQLGEITGIGVETIGFPNVFPNVKEGANTFSVTTGGAGPVNVVIGEGFWDIDQIAAAIEFEVDLVSPGFTLAVTTLGQTTYLVASDPSSLLMNDTPLNAQLGFVYDPDLIVPVASVTAPVPPSLRGETVVFVHTGLGCAGARSLDGDGQGISQLISVAVTEPYLAYQTYTANQYESPTLTLPSPTVFDRIDIRLRDIDGQLLDIGPNQEMFIVLRLWT